LTGNCIENEASQYLTNPVIFIGNVP
jgi:hypothetical protein